MGETLFGALPAALENAGPGDVVEEAAGVVPAPEVSGAGRGGTGRPIAFVTGASFVPFRCSP